MNFLSCLSLDTPRNISSVYPKAVELCPYLPHMSRVAPSDGMKNGKKGRMQMRNIFSFLAEVMFLRIPR